MELCYTVNVKWSIVFFKLNIYNKFLLRKQLRGDRLQTMYSAQINSRATELNVNINSIETVIEVLDASILPNAPNLLTIGFNLEEPETIQLVEKNGNLLTVVRGFEGQAKEWQRTTKIARVFTAYDHNVFKFNLENLPQEETFTTTDKFIDENYVYIVGDTLNGWRVNRYDIDNHWTSSSGTINKPATLADCQGLIYV